ncbi:unnamed protein product [Camellia sinensis]
MAEEVVLSFLEKNDEISDSGEFASERGIDHQELNNIIKCLHGFRFIDAQLSFYMIKRSCLRMEIDGKLKLQRISYRRASTVDYSDDWNPLSTLMIGTL